MYRCAAGRKVHFWTTWNTYQVVLVAWSSARMLCHIGNKAPVQFQCVRCTRTTLVFAFAAPVVWYVADGCTGGSNVHFLTTWNAYQVVIVARSNTRILVHSSDKAPAKSKGLRSSGRTLVFALADHEQICPDLDTISHGVTRTCHNS